MMKKIKAIIQLLRSDEFFLATSKLSKKYGPYGPIFYSYSYDSDKEKNPFFWSFVYSYLKNNHIKKS